MKTQLCLFILLTFSPVLKAQEENCSIQLNHIMVFVDSVTYKEIIKSEVFGSDFAFSYTKNLDWDGLYIIGEENYIEFFHPKSIRDEEYPSGTSWICYSSLKANCIEEFSISQKDQIEFSSNEYFNDLSFEASDSSNLFTVWEMNEAHYVSWVKKPYSDTMSFKPVDYNSPAESDSSKNYLFSNINGYEVLADRKDSIQIAEYFNLIGYETVIDEYDYLMYTNGVDYVKLVYADEVEFPSITKIFFKLNKASDKREIIIGNSRIMIEGTSGVWELNRSINPYSTRSNVQSK